MHTIAIAGAWGYIGRKFTDAALTLGMKTLVHDPGEPPADTPLDSVTRLVDPDEFYHSEADVFHLALHPEHRQLALDILLGRARREPILILNEKPMAEPERPEDCGALIRSVADAGVVMLFDFPELFDPMTLRILDFIGQFDEVVIDEILVQRSKDREARDNPRNRKRMVHIQYQESVHCIAFALNLLTHASGGVEAVLERGISAEATSEPYDPPNPEDYAYVVDGRCDYRLAFGGSILRGCTNFKRHAPFEKTRLITGRGDGRAFTIEADYLEGAKYLIIDGQDCGCDPAGSSYEAVLRTMDLWLGRAGPEQIRSGLYPTPDFTRLTYQLSSLVWRSCYDGRELRVGSRNDLLDFKAGFATAAQGFARYGSGPIG